MHRQTYTPVKPKNVYVCIGMIITVGISVGWIAMRFIDELCK